MSFISPSREDMEPFKQLLREYVESLNLPCGQEMAKHYFKEAFGACLFRQAENPSVLLRFLIEDNVPMMEITPILYPEKSLKMGIDKLASMHYRHRYNAFKANQCLDYHHKRLRQVPYSHIYYADRDMESSHNIVATMPSVEERKMLPPWFLAAADMANDMQCDLKEVPMLTLKQRVKLYMKYNDLGNIVYDLFIVAIMIFVIMGMTITSLAEHPFATFFFDAIFIFMTFNYIKIKLYG